MVLALVVGAIVEEDGSAWVWGRREGRHAPWAASSAALGVAILRGMNYYKAAVISFSAKLKCLLACTVQVQKSYCAMGQRLLQRPSYGCLYKGSASYARRRNRSPSAAHRTSLPSPAVTLVDAVLINTASTIDCLQEPIFGYWEAWAQGVGIHCLKTHLGRSGPWLGVYPPGCPL